MGNRLKEFRRRARLSQETLGALAGTHASNVSKIETGRLEFSTYWAQRFARHLDCSFLQLLDDPDVSSSVPILWTLSDPIHLVEHGRKDPPVSEPMTALLGQMAIRVSGNAWMPEYKDQDVLFFTPSRHPSRFELGKDSAIKLRSGEVVFGRLRKISADVYTVFSNHSPETIDNVAIEWAGPIRFIQRS